MSITAYKIEAVGHDRTGKDFGYVNIMYRYGNKQSCPRPDQCEKMEVMWADESVYGPPAPGSKVGDFIMTWLMGPWNCGSAWIGSTSGYLSSTLPLGCVDLYWLRRWNCNVYNCL